MAENKKSVLLYCDIIHTVDSLTDEEAGNLFKHYLRYVNDRNPEPETRLTALLFEPIKQNLKRDLRKWESKSQKAKDNANKRWDANASERIKNHADDAVKVNVKVTDTVKDTVKDTVTVKDKKQKVNIAGEKKSPAYSECMEIYNSFVLKQTGVTAKINGLTGLSLKKIILHLEKNVNDKQNIPQAVKNAFEYIFTNYSKWDKFHQSQISMNQIESNLINIINSIKNGKSNSKGGINNEEELNIAREAARQYRTGS